MWIKEHNLIYVGKFFEGLPDGDGELSVFDDLEFKKLRCLIAGRFKAGYLEGKGRTIFIQGGYYGNF